MPSLRVDGGSQALFAPQAGTTVTVVNSDLLIPMFISTGRTVNAEDVQVPPLGSITLDGGQWWYASTLNPALAIIGYVIPGGSSWSPSPAQIAAQISLTGINVNVSAAAFVITPSGDTTGTKDTNALTSALALYGAISLAAGTYYVNGITVAGCQLSGAGMQTIIQPGTLYSGGPVITVNANGSVSNVYGYGGTTTTSANPVADFISVPAGQGRWSLTDIDCDHMNGHVITVAASTGMHGRIRGIRGEHNAIGVAIANPSSTGSVTAEINIMDIDLQNCETGSALSLFGVTDCATHLANVSVISSSGADVISQEGSCQTNQMIGVDAGGGTAAALRLAQGTGSSAPTDLIVIGKFQEAGNGLFIEDGTARCAFLIQATRNGEAGLHSDGNGADLAFIVPMFNNNNQLNTGADDVQVDSTAHVGLFGPAYVSTAVANSLTVPATNNVTNDNPTNPGGKSVSGTPTGW